jgi:hypothetical protein
MTRPSRDFKQFARAYPALPLFRIALTYAEREVRRRGRIPPNTGFMLTYVIWADLTQNGRKYSEDQPRVPAGQPGGGQWTSGDGATNDGLSSLQDVASNIDAFGRLTAELPRIDFLSGLTSGRWCVYQFDTFTSIVEGPTNLSCPAWVPWSAVVHGSLLNDNFP